MPRRTTAIERADLAAAERLAPHRRHVAVRVVTPLAKMADQPPLYALGWLVTAAGVLRGDRRLARAGVRMLAAEWIATRAKSAIKRQVDRTRPLTMAEGANYRLDGGGTDAKPLNSFPSGHTAGAIAVARAFASEYPEHAVSALVLAGAAAAIQVPRAMHFPSDVAAGAVIGWVAGGLVARTDDEHSPRSP